MADTEHVLVVGAGAEKLAKDVFGFETLSDEALITPEVVRDWENYIKYRDVVQDQFRQRR